jgi:molybdenum cofactor cytidylyltransferase
MRIGAVVPAAEPGAALLPFGGGTALETVLMRLAEAGVMGSIVVLRPDLTAAAAPLAQRRGARIVVNADPRAELLDSIRLGLASLTGDPDAILIWPVDCPSVSSGTLRVLAHEAARDRAVLPVFRGRRGYPLLLGARLLGDVAAIGPGQGLPALWQRRPEVVEEREVQDAGILRESDSEDEERDEI